MARVVDYKKNRRPSRRRSSIVDRRRLENRRNVYSLDYFSRGGIERRKLKDRRLRRRDRRMGWIRVGEWSSIHVDPDANPNTS